MGRKKEIYKKMRDRGVRKSVAKDVAASLAKSNGRSKPKKADRASADLSSAVVLIQSEMGDKAAKRKLAAKKAAKTRKKKAARRSEGAKRMAQAR
ncbi:MAG: hypothetical protein H0V15_07935 [Solirubrobacterales bacterium]|nr:hypothetical protein [Solirubrobacterales bacterium]